LWAAPAAARPCDTGGPSGPFLDATRPFRGVRPHAPRVRDPY
jgi:hypothetical protein